MAKEHYVGVNGVARKVKQPFVGVSGVARKVKEGFVGVSGVARQFLAGEKYKEVHEYYSEDVIIFDPDETLDFETMECVLEFAFSIEINQTTGEYELFDPLTVEIKSNGQTADWGDGPSGSPYGSTEHLQYVYETLTTDPYTGETKDGFYIKFDAYTPEPGLMNKLVYFTSGDWPYADGIDFHWFTGNGIYTVTIEEI